MQKSKLRNNEGITLIALIITIIVMLILAGVTINLTLGENGIFTTAQKIAKNYTDAQNQEIAELDSFTQLVDKVTGGKIYYATDSVGNAIPVPTGFSPITTSNQGTKDTGFVIKNDTDGNEFVWVPVTGMSYGYERVAWTREGWDYSQGMNGKDETTGSIKITREDFENIYYFLEQMPEDELLSVQTYGGYYIGRYEAGVKEYETKNETREEPLTTEWTAYIGDNTKLVIQEDQEVWNYITRDKAKKVAEDLYNKSINNVKSKLCSSYAWDTALKFIEINNRDYPTNSVGGNYNKASGGTQELQRTGYHSVNNIYDMGGNNWEWTTESCNHPLASYVMRDGYSSTFSDKYPAALRGVGATTAADWYHSFRVTLFM